MHTSVWSQWSQLQPLLQRLSQQLSREPLLLNELVARSQARVAKQHQRGETSGND